MSAMSELAIAVEDLAAGNPLTGDQIRLVSPLARFQAEAGEKSSFADYLNGDWEPPTHKPNLPDNWVSEAARQFVQDVQGGAR